MLQAATAEGVADSIRRAASLVKEHAANALTGDRMYYRRMGVQRSEAAVTEGTRRKQADLRSAVDDAWQERDYTRICELLGPMRKNLSPTQLKKLEFAEKHLS